MKTNAYSKFIVELFNSLKNKTDPDSSFYKIPVAFNQKTIGQLRLITNDILKNDREISLLARWRKRNQRWFPTQFEVTFEGTKKWAKNQLIEKQDRILFFIESGRTNSILIGHLGLNRFDYKNRSCQIDNVIRGKTVMKGIMTHALKTLINFSFNILGVRYLTLTTFADNDRAIALYKSCGFKTLKTIPQEDKRFNLEMILRKSWVQ